MARKKKVDTEISTSNEPKVVEGTHSRFVFNSDGSYEHHINWDRLGEEINNAISTFEALPHTKITTTNQTDSETIEDNVKPVHSRKSTVKSDSRRKGKN